MNQSEYESCIEDMRLPEGALWGLPIVLDLKNIDKYHMGDHLLLTSSSMGGNLAIMEINSIWKPDKKREAIKGKEINTCLLKVIYLCGKYIL